MTSTPDAVSARVPHTAGTADGSRPTSTGRLRVGVDIGGSKVAVLVVDADDAVRAHRSVPAASSEPDEAIAQIAAVIREAVGDAGGALADVAAVGLGVPGRVDSTTGDVTFAVNLGWQHLPLGRRLETVLGIPCVVENDVRAAAVGLYRGGGYGRVKHLIYLGIGTGISAGVVLDGRLHRGVRGMAGEIGHVVLDPDGAACACGLRGCFETIAAGAGIARAAREAIATVPTALAAHPEPTAADVFAAAAAGDGAAETGSGIRGDPDCGTARNRKGADIVRRVAIHLQCARVQCDRARVRAQRRVICDNHRTAGDGKAAGEIIAGEQGE